MDTKKATRYWLSFAASLLLCASVAHAQDYSASWGPEVGAPMPLLEAPDHTGTLRTLPDLAGEQGLLLFLSRSADWWPFCKHQLVQLAQWQAKFAQLGVNVAGMTYDSGEILQAFHAAEALNYPLLQDVDARHVNALGVRNEDYTEDHQAYGIPHPGILFIGADGIIKAKYAVPGYRRRPPFDMLYADVALHTQANGQ